MFSNLKSWVYFFLNYILENIISKFKISDLFESDNKFTQFQLNDILKFIIYNQTSSSNQVNEISDSNQVNEISDSNQVNETSDSNQVSETSDSNQVNETSDSNQVNETSDSNQVNETSDSNQVSDNQVSETSDSNQVSETSDSNQVSETSDSNQVSETSDSNQVSDNQVNETSDSNQVNEYKTLFDTIAESELKDGFDMSSFKYVPDTFMNIETKQFGETVDNPFLKLYECVISDKYDFEDRCQGVRYMQRINYTGGMKYCIQATLSILKDEKYSFEKRYYFFSNNDAYIKLDYEIVNACHKYVYENFNEFNAPLLYKLLSAQFILAHFVDTEYDRKKLQDFLLSVAQDKEQTINYRAECADILYNYGVESEYVQSATNVIRELGELYTQNKNSTIYTNTQNVHDETINKNIINILRKLIQKVKITNRNSGEILEIIRNKYSYLEQNRMGKIMSSLERIMIDTAKYEMLNLSDILLLVWEYIQSQEYISDNDIQPETVTVNENKKNELEIRLLQELEDMDQTCSTGHLSRILNVLSGYFTDNVVQITLKDQLRSNIFARYTKLIKMLPEIKQEKINEELTSNDPSQKDTIKTFLMDFNIEEVLYKEFVLETNMDISEFYETYEKSLEDYFGKLY